MLTKAKMSRLDLPFVAPEALGASGRGDADAASIVASALELVRDSKYPCMAFGSYLLNSLITTELFGTGGAEHMVIYGGGMHRRTFIVNNETGGLSFEGTGAARQHTLQMQNLHFQPNLDDAGYPFRLIGTPGGISNQNCAILNNVYVGPMDEGGQTEGNLDFSEGIAITGLSRPRVDGFRINRNNLSTHKWPFCLNISNDYGPEFHALHINIANPDFRGGADVGILWAGGDEEGGEFKNCLINGADQGFVVRRVNREPGFQWEGGHINHRHNAMVIDGIKIGYVANILVYSNGVDAEDPETPDTIDFLLEDVDNFKFFNPQFRSGGKNRRHFWLEPKAGKAGAIVNEIEIFLGEGSLAADVGTTPPIYCNGATNVTIYLPGHANTVDFVQYPRKLIEIGPNQDAREIKIATPNGVVSLAGDELAGPEFVLNRLSSSVADGDRLGAMIFGGDNDAGQYINWASISAGIIDASAGTEDALLRASVKNNGVDLEVLRMQRPPFSGNTSMLLAINDGGTFTLQQVNVGANNSGGSGQRALTVANSV